MIVSRLDRASAMQFDDYNPGYIIQAVNGLQPLGKEKALESIDSYLEKRDKGTAGYGLFWILRVLFEVLGELGFPPVRIGKPSIPPPAELEKLPRFPIVMIRDIPFLAQKPSSQQERFLVTDNFLIHQ